jgi:hypothetical protein
MLEVDLTKNREGDLENYEPRVNEYLVNPSQISEQI